MDYYVQKYYPPSYNYLDFTKIKKKYHTTYTNLSVRFLLISSTLTIYQH